MSTRADRPDGLPEHLFRWVEAAQRRIGRELEADLGAEARDVGMRRIRILQLVPAGGTRQQELAERALVTKQAMAEIVLGLEADGLVERTPDPRDGRAWLVVRSDRGDRVCAATDSAMAEVERRLAHQVGAARYATFRAVLRDLGAAEI